MKGQFKFKKRKKNNYLIIWFFLFLIIFFLSKEFIINNSLKSFYFYQKWELALLSKKNLLEESRDLKRQNLFYKDSKNVIFNLKRENNDLKARLSYADFLNKKRVLFDVIDQNNLFYQSILISDPNNNLKIGNLIFSKYNFLIGEVVFFVGNKLKKVRTFDSLGFKDNYKIFDGGLEIMKLEGEGQGSGIIKVIAPRDLEFKNSNNNIFLVYKNNDSYLIAKLVDVEFKKQDTNKILYFKMFPNLELLSRVESEIIKKDNE